jgi:hypothetical protein
MEDVQVRVINPFSTNSASIIKYIEPRNRTPSTTVMIGEELEVPVTPMSPSSRSDQAMDDYNDHPISTTRPLLMKFISMRTIGQQFGIRKILQNRL